MLYMRKGLHFFLFCVFIGISLNINAQEPLSQDTTISRKKQPNIEGKAISKDSLPPLISEKKIILVDSMLFNKPEFKPNSKKAVIYSAILPGLGQFYNRKYWKLPIVFGGALGLTYAISWNGSRYNEYSRGYKDLVLGTGTSYLDLFGNRIKTVEDYPGGKTALEQTLKRQKDFFRRNRDLAIIAAVGVYALCMIDAYVDAQLYDFDMSPDLSIRVEPVIWMPTSHSKASIGFQCSINF